MFSLCVVLRGRRIAVWLGFAVALVHPSGCEMRSDAASALDAALRFFRTSVGEADPGWANLFGYYHRRFGLVAKNANGELLHQAPAEKRPEMASLFRRLVDPSATVSKQAIAVLPSVIDRISASALHCDRIELPNDWVEVLRGASYKGGYALTHAVLAAQWTRENGCRPWTELAPLQREQVELLVALAEARDSLEAESEAGTDIWIEALAMLYYSGAGTRVKSEWVDRLLAMQRADGGWSRSAHSKRSDPHATALALWVLLEATHPDAPPITWIPSSEASQ